MNQGPLGTLALNTALQARLNPRTDGLEYKERTYRINDKVMQLRNNYDKNVFNGDIGFVSAVSRSSRTVTVDFEGDTTVYEGEELQELALAYAISIHKSQGSEYKVVVMLMAKAHWVMLQRNLLYTGITRARERLFLVGDGSAVRKAVENNPVVNRNTLLAESLREEIAAFAF
jgi:exodeoxyribonuclease V alpha subunit